VRAMAIVVLCLLGAGLASGSEFSQRRAADRQARQAALKELPEALKHASDGYLNALGGICQWLAGLQAKSDANTLLAEMAGLDSKNAALPGLKKTVEAIGAPAILDEAKQKELATRLKAARANLAGALDNLAATYHRAGLPRMAYAVLVQVLDCDPDNHMARQALGYVRAGTEWKDPFWAQQTQKGNTYAADIGWVAAGLAERTKKGEWFENGKWMAADEADKLHKDPAKPWVIETQHFTLRSTATRKESVQTAERLEGLHQACYREYLDFFLRDKRTPQMQFTHDLGKKMLVHLFAEKKDYDAEMKKAFKSSVAIQALLMLLPGFYTPATHASYFNQMVPDPYRTLFMQNQVASQILSEYAQTGVTGPKPWIGEGLCWNVQYALPDDSGRFTLPVGHKHPAVTKAAEMLQKGELPPLAALFALDSTAFHNPLTQNNGEAASAFCRFLMETRDGAYVADFLDFVYDSYKGQKSANLSEYVGMDPATLEKEFQEYLKL